MYLRQYGNNPSAPLFSFFRPQLRSWGPSILRPSVFLACSTNHFRFEVCCVFLPCSWNRHTRLTMCQDHSMLHINGGATTGTLAQILASADSGGKALAAVNVPAPGSVAPLHALATDAHAWNMTIDLPWCGRRWEMPRSELRWAEIATQSTSHPLNFAINGFVTHIEVKVGSQFLVVCRPRHRFLDTPTSFRWLDRFRRVQVSDLESMELQGYRLQAGTVA